jgi:Protein of unknown function (DUF2911)
MRICLLLLLSGLLWASTNEEVTVFHFNAPVEVPGKILPAGKYLFKLDQREELNVVKIESPDEQKVFGVFVVKPDYSLRAPRKPGLVFEPGRRGAPPAIKAWFYPGDKFGKEFIYRK